MYNDRGIIKWAPFDALVNFSEVLDDLRFNRGKVEKPQLCDDAFEMMNQNIKDAILSNSSVMLTYFDVGYIKYISGRIKKIDLLDHSVILDYDLSINISNILNIEKDD